MNVIKSGSVLIATHKSFKLEAVNELALASDAGCRFERCGDLHVFAFTKAAKSRRVFRKRCKDLVWH